MTVTETPVEVGIHLGDVAPHLECCRAPRFLCGAAYHPEASAGRAGLHSEVPADVCPTCIEIATDELCPPWRPTHMHCPVPGPLHGFPCPWA